MTLNVFPLSCVVKFFTFSNMNALGLFSFNIFAILKNNVPLVSSNPRFNPAFENG